MNAFSRYLPKPTVTESTPANFVRLRYVDAIERGDDATASRLLALIDVLLNGALATSQHRLAVRDGDKHGQR